MIKLSKQSYVVIIALFIAFVFAFFPTSYFVKNQFTLNSNIKQQYFNEAGIYTISPFQAAEFYSNDPQKSIWIDLRDTADYSKSHLKVSINQSFSQLKSTTWQPDDLILIYGKNTQDAQEAVAYLRQVKNARAFAIKGGFNSVRRYLIDPVDIAISNQLSDIDLQRLLELRNELSGDKASVDELMNKLKSSKSKSIREGC